ncbi:MAG: ABC transporter permease [Bryobacterales bacterium]|nr:ABC transporter permease [Bryobacterales bacterium]
MGHLLSDLRYGWRQLARAPVFAGVAILTLALGIGANTAIFSLIDGVLLRPMPYHDADRLVAVWEDASFVSFPKNTPAPANWVDWSKRNRVFTAMAAIRSHNANLSDGGTPEMVFGRGVTANFFDILGVTPLYGRAFSEAEDRPDARLVVLSHGLWKRRFGGDPNIVGKPVSLSGQHYEVTGIMPPAFRFPLQETEYWVPAGFTPRDLSNRGSHFLRVIARLKPGVSLAQARQDMNRVADELRREYPDMNRQLGAVVVPLREELSGGAQTSLLVLSAAAAAILLIGCANLANLLLARATSRHKEIAVRIALGARRRRLIAQLLTESLLLATLGGTIGLLLATSTLRLLAALVPLNMTSYVTLTLDSRLLLFAALTTLATGVMFGLFPALQAGGYSLAERLRETGRGGIGGRSHRLREGLVIAEVALAVVLLAGAGLLVRALQQLGDIEPGYRANNLLTAALVLSPTRYARPEDRLRFYDSVLANIRTLPGVQGASFTGNVPLSSSGNTVGFVVEGRPNEANQDALYRPSLPGYLETLGARLKEGRYYDARDTAQTQPVVVINETFARRYWPDTTAVGKRMRINQTEWRQIIGVVHDIQERDLETDAKPAIYVPFLQFGSAGNGQVPFLVVRTAGDPMAALPAVRQAVWSVDRIQPVSNVRTGEEWMQRQLATRKQQVSLLGTFAALALLLAGIGIYGVLSYAVSQRTREIGLRLALGATPRQVLRNIFGQGFRLALIGLAAGVAASLAAARAIQSLLYRVPANDAPAFASAVLLLGLVAAVACYLPARRATLVDPMEALRDD